MKIAGTPVWFLLALLLSAGCAGSGKTGEGGGRLAEAHQYESRGEYRKALKELEKGLEEDPYSGSLYASLGNLKLGLGDFQGAKSAFWNSVKLYEATGDYKSDNDPFNRLRAAYDNLGVAFTLLGEYEAALTYHRHAEIPPYDQYLPQRGMSFAYLLKGENEKALDLYGDYVRRFPAQQGSMEPLRHLMEETAAGRVPREAFLEYLKAVYAGYHPQSREEHFERAAALAPGYPHWDRLKPQARARGSRLETPEEQKDFLFVRSLIANGNLEEARRRLSKLKKMYPDNPLVYQYLGVVQMKLGKPGRAEKSFRKGIELAPDAVSLSFDLAGAYFQQRKLDKAKETALGITRKDPAFPGVNLFLARILVEEKKYDEALSWAVKESELHPENPGSYANLGELYANYFNDYEKAAEAYGKSLELNPDDLEIRKWKADAHVRLGDYARAREEMIILRRGLAKTPQLYGRLVEVDVWIKELENKMKSSASGN